MSTSSSISRSSKHAKKVANDIITKWRIFKGDRVQVNTGKDRGQIGTVSKVFRKENRMIVQGCNLVKKHVKKTAKA
jgi:large subunit ribosomal protein L24